MWDLKKQKCSSKAQGRKQRHHRPTCPLMSIMSGCVGSASTPNPSALSSLEMSGVHPVPHHRGSALRGGRKAFSILPCWSQLSPRLVLAGRSRGRGRSHIEHTALCCSQSCQPAWLSSLLTHLPLPLALAPSHTGNTNQTCQWPRSYLPKA